MNHPRVSVVIPAFNVEAYIGECVDSVLRQTYSDYEIVVVDDGSTDRTPEIALQYGNRVRLIRQPNRGLFAARNTGILASRGEFVALLDADDVWLPEYLEAQLEILESNGGNCLVFCDAYVWDGERKPSVTWNQGLRFDENDPLLTLVSGYSIPSNAVVIPRDILMKVGLFRDVSGEDMNLWKRLALEGTPFRQNPTPLVLYRRRPGSISHSRGSGRAATENLLMALNRIRRDVTFPAHVRRAASTRASALHQRFSWLAAQAVLIGEFEDARACWLNAFRIHPWNPLYLVGAALVTVMPKATQMAVVKLQYLRRTLRRA